MPRSPAPACLALLVVDDSPTVRSALIQALPRGLAVRVEEADNGERALQACACTQPDVMFLDLAMPVLDGYGVPAKLRDLPRRPRVVVVSTDATESARASLLALGADEVVAKPWRPGEIERALRGIGVV